MSQASPHRDNRLLAALPNAGYRQFMDHSHHASLDAGATLARSGEPFQDVYFPSDGLVSLSTAIDSRPALEIGVVGYEGMVGSPVALDSEESPTLARVQGGGQARAMASADFRDELATNDALHGLVKRYLQVVMGQFGQSNACLRFHRVTPRLVRWLLNAHDRLGGDQIEVTHEQLAGILGVRRVGITGAATGLQRQNLIRYQRGRLTIRDRAGLEAQVCGCYASDKARYDRIMRF